MAKSQALTTTPKNKSLAPKMDWEDELAAQARDERARVLVGVPRITHKGGALRRDDELIPGNNLDCIIVDSVLSNEYFEGAYIEGQAATPVCYAFGTDTATMAPHPDSPKKQSTSCVTCPKNVFGSAEQGRGKACKNNARLLIISPPKGAKAGDFITQEKRQISVPPTSLANWSKYLGSLVETTRTGNAIEAVTNISAGPRPKGSGHCLMFKQSGLVDPELMAEGPLKVRKLSAGLLIQPFPRLEETQAEPPKPSKKRKF